VKKRFFPICLVSVVLIALIAVLVPSCDGTKGTIEVKVTLDDADWPSSGTGAVNYTLTGPGGSPISGTTSVPKSFSVDAGNWTCAYVSGGPAGAYLESITPSATQSVPGGGNITFTLNFKTTPITIRIEPPEKDAEVREYYPDTNFGGASEMWVAPSGPNPDSRKHRAFVWFSLASLPTGAQVQSATLYLYHIGCYGGGTHTNGAYRVTDVWEEMLITSNNQFPSAPGPTYDISFDICDVPKWRSWDVTPDIDALAIETGWVSWVIKHIDEDAQEQATVVYATKEGGIAPYLEITYLPGREKALGQGAIAALEQAKTKWPGLTEELDKIKGKIDAALKAIIAGNKTLAMEKKRDALGELDDLITGAAVAGVPEAIKDYETVKANIEKMIEEELGTAAIDALKPAYTDCNVGVGGLVPSTIRRELGNITTKIEVALNAINAGKKTKALEIKKEAVKEIKTLIDAVKEKQGVEKYRNDLEKARANVEKMLEEELGRAAIDNLNQAQIDAPWIRIEPEAMKPDSGTIGELHKITGKIDDALKAIDAGNKDEALEIKRDALDEIKALIAAAEGKQGAENYIEDLENAKANIQEMINREGAA